MVIYDSKRIENRHFTFEKSPHGYEKAAMKIPHDFRSGTGENPNADLNVCRRQLIIPLTQSANIIRKTAGSMVLRIFFALQS
jgi:hypothetical protein